MITLYIYNTTVREQGQKQYIYEAIMTLQSVRKSIQIFLFCINV